MRVPSLMSTTLLVAVLSVSLLGSSFLVEPVGAFSSNPNAKDVTLFWHYTGTPVSVGGIQTHQVLNTSAHFDFQTQQLARQNSFYKPTGLPSITVDFFAYPNMAGPVRINGTWQVFVWVNSSAFHPTNFNIEFREYPLGSGTATWDSGQINPTVTSPIGAYVDVPVYSYNLTTPTPLAHTFAQSSTIDVTVSVNDGSAADARIWYDSTFYPSKVILPAVDRGRPAKIWTEDSTGFVTSAFNSTAGLKVLVNTNATDPFGGYDINATAIGSRNTLVVLTVTAPNGTVIVNGQRMTLMLGGITSLNNILQYNVTLALGFPGQYSVTIWSTDNSGNTEQLSFSFTLGQLRKLGAYVVDSKIRPLAGSVLSAWIGGFQVFSGVASSIGTVNGTLVSANYTLKVSWQGVNVYQSSISIASDQSVTLVTAVYDPTIIVTDDTGAALSGAVVSVTHPNGTVLPTLMTTGVSGTISLVRAPGGGWGFTVFWKTVNVYGATVQIGSDGPYDLRSKVYQFTVSVKDNGGLPVQGAYVVLYNAYGVVYDFKATDASGSVVLKVPVGTYTVEALYSTTYLFTPVTATENQTSAPVNSSGSLTLTLRNFPPSIIYTSAFLVLVLSIVAIVAVALVTYFVMKKRLPTILTRTSSKDLKEPPNIP